MRKKHQQYHTLKEEYKDVLLLFRTGDLYEAFGNDATVLSEVMGITIQNSTENNKARQLACLPFHSLDVALRKLVKCGFKVAICEELESPPNGKNSKRRDSNDKPK